MPNPADSNAAEPTRIWRFLDGKRGHEQQSLGLVDALARLRPVVVSDVAAGQSQPAPGDNAGPPRLLIGAGHATHRALRAAKRKTGARAIVLMRPSFGMHHFDLCVVPEHDGVAPGANVLVTRGVLNPIVVSTTHDPQRGLILIGGPSRHHDWLEAEILDQIDALTSSDDTHWTISNSRRTPATTNALLRNLSNPQIAFVDWSETGSSWIVDALRCNAQVWVSEDSVSMLYEALTSGASVGVLAVPRRSYGRVVRGVATLVRAGCVTPFVLWQSGKLPAPMQPPLAEADRCARWINDHWL